MTPRLPGRPLGGIALPHRGFARLKVLDFSLLLPGPYATQMLAELGMKVTRVELPHFPDIMRSAPPMRGSVGAAYWLVNQRKKELSLDFRKPAGLKRVQKMIRGSDVLVEGFRPGTMERIGLGYAACRRLNPGLVYCSLSGYAPEGAWGRKAGHDINFQAVSGLMGLGAPAVPLALIADLSGSMAAVAGILAALLEGRGRHVRISLSGTVHSLLPVPLSELAATGEDPSLIPRWWKGDHPFYRLYATSDGRQLAVGALEKGFAFSLLDALGLGELKGLAARPEENAAALGAALERAFAERTLAEWEARLETLDVCVTPVYRLAEAAAFLARIRRPAAA